jgi:hypothetical protein
MSTCGMVISGAVAVLVGLSISRWPETLTGERRF